MRLEKYSVGEILIYDPTYPIHIDNPWTQNIGERFEVMERSGEDYVVVRHLPTNGSKLHLQRTLRLDGESRFTFRALAFKLDTTSRTPDWEV